MKRKLLLGERLRLLRIQSGIKQKQLGELFGLSENSIGMMERGHRGTTLQKLVQLAEYFHVSTDYLLGITDDPTWRGSPPEEES